MRDASFEEQGRASYDAGEWHPSAWDLASSRRSPAGRLFRICVTIVGAQAEFLLSADGRALLLVGYFFLYF